MNARRYGAILLTAALLPRVTAVQADVLNMPSGLRSLETVLVDHPGNAPDENGLGAVAYPFRIGKYEVTTAQYVEFLNAKARSDPDGSFWNNDMDSIRSGEGVRCDIRRTGEKGHYRHSVAPELANRPVTHVSFLDACRFCNWLHNGQGDGDTETGAYTLAGYAGRDGRRIRRNPGARWFVPTEDEWYKAAYFDPHKPGGDGCWDYPTRSDVKPNRFYTSVSDIPSIGFRVAAAVEGAQSAPAAQPTLAPVVTAVSGDFPRRPWRDPETGEPFFPLAWFSYQSDEQDLDDIAREGGNLVLFVNSPTDLDSDEQLRSLFPALEKSYEHPPFIVRHNHEGITRSYLTDSVADLTTLPLEDREHYYLIVSNNSGTFTDIAIRMKLPHLQGTEARPAAALNEEWARIVAYSEESGEWVLDTHTMCFGDINIWVIPKARPVE